jgi:hypothetical protein
MFSVHRETLNLCSVIVSTLALVLAFAVMPAAEAASGDDAGMSIRARAVSTINVSRAANDLFEIRIDRWSSEAERSEGVKTLVTEGNAALAELLAGKEAVGWSRFDPRGGGGPGRDPRKSMLRYARLIETGDAREIILITNHYIGFGQDARAADGAKLTGFPLSLIMLTLEKDDDGDWKGYGRLFVGTRIRFDSTRGKFIVDEFPSDPVFLRDVKLK